MGARVNARIAGVGALRRALLEWYDHNRRSLPWRVDRDPYRVWVAEVMLQQTRVAVAVPAYERFLRVFPSLERLATASEDDVLAQWSGLGYYARARSLHGAARQLVAAGEGFPRDYGAARRLPGIGAYTAAAVLSIVWDEPHAAVDGNVVRVLSRLRRLDRPDARGEPHANLAASLLDRRRPGDWNQAVMELGETICTPARPRCEDCPLARHCWARRDGVVERHPPAPSQSRARERVEATMLVARDRRGGVVLERGVFSYLPRMWLPLVDDGASARRGDRVAEIRHAITHRTFRIRVIARWLAAQELAEVLRRPAPAGERRVFSAGDLERIGRSSLLRKALSVT